ncbi:hypothetical protein [Ideonella livida]|uniref:Uncharacterized protein n=1 Tax=Ideonella livida TaxID=2707176 RepID=A0A7C9TIK7_9BURK|nr:hypothetical protein [Ideonella livida]NDY91399.1 hypothetical protein [Ideonella livida]
MDRNLSFEDSFPLQADADLGGASHLQDSDALDDGLGGAGGLPGDRSARIAARRAFVEMKQLFMRAVEDLHDGKGRWLKQQVRYARHPGELWQLRSALVAALKAARHDTRLLRGEVYHGLDTVFPAMLAHSDWDRANALY